MSFLLVCSCKKDEADITHVPAYLNQMVPYQHGQTVRFIDGTGGGFITIVEKSTYISEVAGCQGCPIKERNESFKYRFKSGSETIIQFEIDNRPIIFLNIMSPLHSFNIGAGYQIFPIEGVAQPNCNDFRQTCISTITLNGTTYSNVVEIKRSVSQPLEMEKAYYTVEKGLIGFRYVNGVTYSLFN